MNDTEDLVAAVADLKDRGYGHEFRIKNKQLFSDKLDKGFGMGEFTIDEAYGFSSIEDDGTEGERLFAVTLTKENIKGYLVDAYAGIETIETDEVREKFDANNAHIHYLSDAETKYGLPRVKKAEFNQDPDRYILRVGFPDFPACPFGNSFEALGWDKQDKHYVWFVTSIIKDDRLVREQYKK
ncbi:hypothetical protein FKX85_05705 [Echinicola soli]|uniref:Uncharacterized protein n=1 Tax=Echinicola soli TaxID=2591634 RepID=A0A514CFF6_9BACT|nr:hypothetical protein [Echinicola soli]QDH78552.1 hypothetical protein FKX85_05705 [Echinicola soli]